MFETVTSLQRDEEYLPNLKSCVKQQLDQIIDHRATLAAQGKNYGHHYTMDNELGGDKVDFIIDRAFDEIKLQELREHEPKLWGPTREKMVAAWKNYGKEGEEGEDA